MNTTTTGEDEDSTSSLSSSPSSTVDADCFQIAEKCINETEATLDEFRNNWHRELNISATKNSQNSNECCSYNNGIHNDLNTDNMNCQTIAEGLFRQGIELEQSGKVYDAIRFYKKAEQLVPDIEFKFYETNKLNTTINLKQANKRTNDSFTESLSKISLNNLSTRELVSKFHLDLTECGKFISNNCDNGVINTETHISKLPLEILIYIMRWIVSTDLDLRSLEQCSNVCKGFYICARDDEIWRHVCFSVWGFEDDLTLSMEKYNSWRQMFIERPRINFHGCYISKTTYLRMGENSFQDQYYRPVHLIEYYRYIRFMPDRTVYMMTSSDEPSYGVIKMNNLSQHRPEIMKGTYRLQNDNVIIVLKKNQKVSNSSLHTYNRQNRGNNDTFDANISKYCIEFIIINSSKRRHCQLQWKHYSIQQFYNKNETTSTFELVPSKYPPLWFSPVRSYNLKSEAPLKW